MASKKNQVPIVDLPVKVERPKINMKKDYFPKVREAREALKERALEIFETYLAIINEAREDKQFDTAFKATQWLIEHMPKGEGDSIVDGSSTNPPKSSGPSGSGSPSGPVIQIGLKLGGIEPKQIPAQVIEVEGEDE